MIILAALTLAAASPAAAPRPSPAQFSQALTRMGFSPAGVAIMSHQPAPAVNPQVLERRAQQINAAIKAAVEAVPFDVARFEKALQDRAAFSVDVQRAQLGQMMRIMRALPPADRPLFARGLVTRPSTAAPAH